MKSLRILLSMMLADRSRAVLLAVSIATSVAGGAATAGLVALFHQTIRDEKTPENGWLIFIGLWLAHGILNTVSSIAITSATHRAIRDFRLHLANGLLNIPFPRLEALGRATIVETLSQSISTVIVELESSPSMLTKLITAIVLVGYLIWLSPVQAAVVGAGLVVGGLVYALPMIWYQKLASRRYDAERDAQNQIHHFVDGLKELLLGRGRQRDFFNRHLKPALDAMVRATEVSRTVDYTLRRWGEMLAFLMAAIILFVLPDAGLVSYAEILSFAVVLLFAIDPLIAVVNFAYFNLKSLNMAFSRVEALGLEIKPVIDQTARDLTPSAAPVLELDQVTYRFDQSETDEVFQMGPVSFSAGKPEIIFITGGNGSGKSTLAKILCGLYPPASGAIRLNGCEIGPDERTAYREQFSVVFFDFYLFESILGVEGRFDDQARSYLEKLHLHRKLSVRNGAFSTSDLSQGQRKRLALLTAWLEDRPFYLFDEWAADQDPEFKKVFYYELLPELKARGKTVFVISHDELYFHTADRVLHLVEGRLA